MQPGEKRDSTAANVDVVKKVTRAKSSQKTPNCYMMFMKEHFETIRQQMKKINADVTFDQVNNELRKQWHSKSSEIKNSYKVEGYKNL